MLWVSQKHCPLLSNAVAVVKVYQLVEGGEGLVPHVVLAAAVLEHLEMLNMVPITKRTHKQRRGEIDVLSGMEFIIFYTNKKYSHKKYLI